LGHEEEGMKKSYGKETKGEGKESEGKGKGGRGKMALGRGVCVICFRGIDAFWTPTM